MLLNTSSYAVVLMILSLSYTSSSVADDLAKQSQNPLGTVISLPLENNFYTGIGPSESSVYALNIKPVYPMEVGNWNLINRFILPAIYSKGHDAPVPPGIEVDTGYSGPIEIAQGSAFGLGDLTYQAYFSPRDSGDWIWGVGPVLILPTATEARYASDKLSLGAAFVALSMPGNWVYGILAQNVWSVAGDSDAADVNSFLFQYFLNYNMGAGWYLSSTPVITANWEADSDDAWTIPLGIGLSKTKIIGKTPWKFQGQVQYYAKQADSFGPEWLFKFTVTPVIQNPFVRE